MIKGFRQIASLTVVSRILGMVRDMAFAYFLGAGALMDGWVLAFKIPNLARRIFGEGAASSSLIPVYSQELHKDRQQADLLANTVVTAVFVILAAFVLLGEGIIWGWHSATDHESTRLKLALAGTMLPYMVIICVVAILAGILNTHRHFAMPAAAPIVLNIFIIGALCSGGLLLGLDDRKLVFLTAWFVIIAGLIQFAIQLPPLTAAGVRLRPAWDIHSPAFKRILVLMGPMILGLTATQLNTMADDFIAIGLSGSAEKGEFFTFLGRQFKYPVWDGAVSQLYYSQRLYQFPLGVFGISLGLAIFPVMSADAAIGDMKGLCKTISRGIRGAIFIAVPATIGLIIVRRPLVSVIFERGEFTSADTVLTAGVLFFYSLGLCGFFMQQILARSYYSLQDSGAPARSAALAVAVNVVLNLTLIWWLGTGGLALSTAVCSYLQVIILAVGLRNRLGSELLVGLWATIYRTALSTAVMGVSGLAALKATNSWPTTNLYDLARIALVVPVCAIVYALIARIFGMEELSLITGKGR